MTEVAELWTACSGLLKTLVPEATWRTWFEALEPVELDDFILVLSAPGRPVRDGVEERFMPLLEKAASESGGRHLQVRIVSRPAATDRYSDATIALDVDPRTDRTALRDPDAYAVAEIDVDLNDSAPQFRHRAPQQWDRNRFPRNNSSSTADSTPNPPLNPRYTFDNFVIGASNRFAHAAAQRVAETPAASYNPLFIYGGSGLGKTHLLHAVGHYVGENFADLRVRYVPTETMLNDLLDAIRTNTQMAFKRRYRECDVLLVDDVQFLEKKEQLQIEFFHTFNWLYEGSKQIVLSCDRKPRSIPTLEERLYTRFEWGLTIDVQPPELETRLAILRKKADGERIPISNEVLELIATHVRDNIRELEGALIRVTAYASLNHEAPTLQMAEHVLSDIIDASRPRQITPNQILEATAAKFGFSIEDLRGTSRRHPLVDARQIGMYLFRDLTDFSYPAIAREFGGRDHTTVIHAFDKVSRLMKESRQVYDQVTDLIQNIKGGA